MKIPLFLSNALRRWLPLWDRDVRQGRERNPFADEAPEWDATKEKGSPRKGVSPWNCAFSPKEISEGENDTIHGLTPLALTLGILEEPFHHHWPYIAACRELGVPYRLISITDDDWAERVVAAGCDAFLVWPCMGRRALRELFDDRLRIMEREMGLRVYPRYDETWMYENKYRLADWLRASGLPHPTTRRFFRAEDARSFAATAPLPVVVKTRLGAASCGVWVVRNRRRLRRIVRRAFGRGLIADFRHRSEAEAGAILVQDYVPILREWRMVRVGDSYFGHVKGRQGEYHSGSGRVEWESPTARHLNFLRRVTDAGGFRSMGVDVFETETGDLLVNELQTVFGAKVSVDQTRVDGVAGRFVWEEGGRETGYGPSTSSGSSRIRDAGFGIGNPNEGGGWRFEAGDFARNACCNLRVLDLLEMTGGGA